MSFSASAIFPGDIHDSALRVGRDLSARRPAAGLMAQACRSAVELGWTALLIAEAQQGAGGQFTDLAAVAEACGKTGLALPLATLCDGPQRLLAAALPHAAAASALRALAAGGTAVGLLRADRARPLHEADGALTGLIEGADAPENVSHWLLVLPGRPARRLLLIENGAAGLSLRRYARMDGRPLADIVFDVLAAPPEAELLAGAELDEALDQVERAEILLAGAENVGAMGQLIEATIEYLSTRKQFGVTLSTFQALRHQLAGIYVDYENLRAQVQAAYADADRQLPSARTVSLLQMSLARVGRRLAETAIQLHGGMGMTEELLAARLAKRLMMNAFEHGGAARHLERAATATFHCGPRADEAQS